MTRASRFAGRVARSSQLEMLGHVLITPSGLRLTGICGGSNVEFDEQIREVVVGS
jgi:hypothetical protein